MTTPHDEGMTPSRDDPVTTPPPRQAPVGMAIGRMLSGLMLLLGVFVLARLLIRPRDPLTPSIALDIAFGLFFVGRGALYFWSVRRRPRG